jgi:plastocyanin
MNETMFYVLGAGLASLAVITSFVGLRVERFPGSNAATAAIILLFAGLVGGTTTFAVLHAKDEEEHEAAALEHASEELEEREGRGDGAGQASEGGPSGGEGASGTAAKAGGTGAGAGAGATLQLAADPTQIAFDKTSLSAKAGTVTIDFDNPAAIEHNVAVEQDSEILAESDTITQGRTSVTVDLAAGSYAYVCTVPGHEEAGMKGTLTVK